MTDTPTDLHVVESPAPVGLSDAEIDAARELLPLAAETPAPEAVWQWLRQIAESKPDEMRARVAELEANEKNLALDVLAAQGQACEAYDTAWNDAIRAAAERADEYADEWGEPIDEDDFAQGAADEARAIAKNIRTLLRNEGSSDEQ